MCSGLSIESLARLMIGLFTGTVTGALTFGPADIRVDMLTEVRIIAVVFVATLLEDDATASYAAGVRVGAVIAATVGIRVGINVPVDVLIDVLARTLYGGVLDISVAVDVDADLRVTAMAVLEFATLPALPEDVLLCC